MTASGKKPGRKPGRKPEDAGERFDLDPAHTNPERLKQERRLARELKQSPWWKKQVAPGKCHYCGGIFPSDQLTMDHVLPLARGGKSVKGNVVPACTNCNRDKKLKNPLDDLFAQIEKERK